MADGFVERMQVELVDLQSKSTALEKFLDSEMSKALSSTEQVLLAAQHAAMTAYEHILSLRIGQYVK